MVSPIHICHVFSSFDPGGAEVRAVTLINALGPHLRHTIIATNGRYGAAERIQADRAFTLVPPPPGKGRLWYSVQMSAALKRLRPDLLLTYNWGAIDAVIAGAVTRLCPVVHAEDGFGPEEAQAMKGRRVLTRRLVLPRIFGTIVPSKVLVEIARTRFRIPAAKLLYIPNGVDHHRFRPGRDASWRRSRGVPEDAVLCGAVGGLRREKNLTLLIQAFAQAKCPDLWLAFAGDGPCRAELESAAHASGASSRIIFAGSLHDPAPFYRSLDILAISSLTEQMPLSLLEAMASGLPVVATDVGDIREMLGSDAQIVVPRGDVEQFTAGLARLAGDADLRENLGRRNRTRCIDGYTQDGMIRTYRSVYEAAIGRPLERGGNEQNAAKM